MLTLVHYLCFASIFSLSELVVLISSLQQCPQITHPGSIVWYLQIVRLLPHSRRTRGYSFVSPLHCSLSNLGNSTKGLCPRLHNSRDGQGKRTSHHVKVVALGKVFSTATKLIYVLFCWTDHLFKFLYDRFIWELLYGVKYRVTCPRYFPNLSHRT